MHTPRHAALPALVALVAATAAAAAVPQRNPDGSVILPPSAAFHVRFTAPNPSYQHQAWRNAIATINAVPGSALRVIEDAASATPLAPVSGDGINSIAVMSTTDWQQYDARKPFVVGCYGYECDVWFNNVDFNVVGGTGSYAYDLYYDAESLALSAFLMIAARMDNDVRFERVLYSHPPYGVGRWQLTLDEKTWLQTLFGAPPPSQLITGAVRRNGAPIAYAYVCAALAAGGDDVCVTAAANGAYSLRVPVSGSYRVVASPLTTNRNYLFTSPYHTNNPANVNFLATAYATPVAVGAGQSVSGIDFNVSPTASMSEPSEPQEPVAIATDGTPVTFNAWPCGNEDALTFNSTSGKCYAIGTRATGIAGGVGPERLDRSKTVVTLKSGSTILAQDISRDALDDDPRSLLLFCETTSRMLTLSVGQREPDACGPGFYYDVSVNALISPPVPTITSPTSASPRSTTAGLRGLFLVTGNGLMPGVTVEVGGQPATVEYVEGCSQRFNCTYIVAETPAALAAGTYGLTVTNPDGRAASSASSFVVLPVQDGSVFDMYWYGVFPLPVNLYSAEGMCWGDVDNDGDLDLFRTGDESAGGVRLLRNNWIGSGAYSFSDDTTVAGLPADSFANPMFSCAFADVDNDADLDLIVTFNPEAGQDSIRLYVSSFAQYGTVHFTEQATARGITQSSSNLYSKVFPLDFNNDGRLDFFVASNLPASGQPYRPNRLYRNTGNGTFIDAADTLVGMGASNHRTNDAIIGDFNNDGWPDLMLFNIAVTGGHNGNALFLLNNGQGGFSNATAAANVNVTCNATTCNCTHGQAADFNNDDKLDFACFYYTKDSTTVPRLYLNDGVGAAAHFTDVAGPAGFTSPALPQRFCPTMTVLDADLDGDQDIYLGCRQFGSGSGEYLDLLLSNNFRESGSVTFRNATTSSGLASQHNYSLKGRTDVATAIDWDNDFDDDVFLSGQQCQLTTCTPVYDLAWGGAQNNPYFPSSLTYLFTEDSLKVALKGVVSNTHGVGARVRAVRDLGSGIQPTVANCRAIVPPAGEHLKRQMVTHGHNQQPYLIQFNWGDPLDPAHASRVDCLDINWPSGARQTLTDLPMHDSFTILEAADHVTVLRVEPNSGPTSGNTNVTIRGLGFVPGAVVYFGPALALGPVTVSADGSTITCRTPQWQPAGTVDVTVVNPDTTQDTLEAGFTFANTTSIDAFDPNPLMRVGPAVSSDVVKLGSIDARRVFGFAADGVTPVVLRIPVASAGSVRFNIFDEFRRTTDIGSLRAPGSGTSGPTVTVSTVLIGTQNMAIAILQAPSSFWRSATDDSAALRPITIEATFQPAGGGSTLYISTFFVVRPPILLEHGIWSDEKTWDWALMKDARFVVFAHRYQRSNDQYFWNNLLAPHDGVVKTLETFRNKGLAGTKAMVFGHSMGGILSRIHASNTRTAYLRDDNFGAGDFYGLVTVDTPHIGSPLADAAILIRDHSVKGPALEFWMDKAGMNIRKGALWDLQTSSYETTLLPAVTLPAHAFVSVGGSDILSGMITYPAPTKLMIRTLQTYGGADLSSIFPPGMQHDFVVSRPSQEGRLASANTTLFHFTNTSNLAIHFNSVTQESNPNTRAIRIINTPMTDPLWATGFPAATLESTSMQEDPMNQRIRTIVTGCALVGSVSGTAACQSATQSDTGKIATANTITITAPAPNSVFHPGDSVTVTVQPSGFTPIRMMIMVTDTDGDMLTSSPWTLTLSVSQSALGAAMIRAVAIDASETAILTEIPIQVAPTTATLRALTVSPNDIGLFGHLLREQLSVTGHYSDGIDRDISRSLAGTRYESGDPSIVTVSADGLMTGVGVGRTTIVARNGSSQAGVAVRVSDLPAPLTFSAKTTLSWPPRDHAVGYDVVRGDLNALRSSGGNFTTSTTLCVVRNATATTAFVSGVPASGNGFFYLYRFRYPGGPVSYEDLPDYAGHQVGLRNAEIAASAGACAP